MSTTEKLTALFDYQRFERNKRLQDGKEDE